MKNNRSIIIKVRSVFLPALAFFLLAGCFNFNRTFSYIPAAPTNLAVSNESVSAKLTWTDNSDNEWGFSIERKRAVGGTTIKNFSVIATVGQDVTTYTDSGPFQSGSTYIYRVSAYNDAGFSDYSNEASFNY